MQPRPGTFSIVACDQADGSWGVAVQSKFLCVGSVVPWARAGIGAVATQAWANVSYGTRGLELLEQSMSAQQTVQSLVRTDEDRDRRQLGIVDAQGRAAAYTGSECPDWAGHVVGPGYCCQGNILAGPETVVAMAQAYERTEGSLADRLVAALAAGQAAGGDRRGQQSAALLVVKADGGYGGYNDRYIDLRVDDHVTPIDELRRLLKLFRLYFLPGDPHLLTKIEGGTAIEICQHLRRLGYFAGPDTIAFDPSLKSALREFAGIENFEERIRDDDRIDLDILEFMRTR